MIEYCINKALEVEYQRGRERLYCVITDKRGRIVSEGRNSFTRTHPRQAQMAAKAGLDAKVFLHAEISAIISDKSKRGYKITVVRVDSKGKLKYAEPCCICKLAIKQAGLKVIEYSA